MMDIEFKKLKDAPGMELIDVKTTSAREHVGEIELAIRLIKERARCIMKTLVIAGILNVHNQIVIHMIYFVTMTLNAVPDTLGVSEIYSPRDILTQRRHDMDKDRKVRLGTYTEASEDAQIKNTMKSRTEECVSLCPSGNWQGSTMCFNLNNGVVVTQRTIIPLPMPDRIKKLVNRWGN